MRSLLLIHRSDLGSPDNTGREKSRPYFQLKMLEIVKVPQLDIERVIRGVHARLLYACSGEMTSLTEKAVVERKIFP
jgi:hypothetical protein